MKIKEQNELDKKINERLKDLNIEFPIKNC